MADSVDPHALAAAGRALAEWYRLARVVTWTEWRLVLVARQLGLPAAAPEVMQGCRNKATARALFARHGVPFAVSRSMRTAAGVGLWRRIASATRVSSSPLTRRAAASSALLVRTTSPTRLPHRPPYHGVESTQVLVEEHLDGPEVSVECITYQGETSAVAVIRMAANSPLGEGRDILAGTSVSASAPTRLGSGRMPPLVPVTSSRHRPGPAQQSHCEDPSGAG
ncbi:hypothetical protein HEP87_55125 [Streptomyces sp. S1D4-11]